MSQHHEDRPEPHDLVAERAVLGACLMNPEAFEIATSVVQVADFYRKGHQGVFRTMHRLHDAGSVIDLVTVKNKLTTEDLEEAGGPAYIASLTDGVPRSSNVAHYARVVKEHADARAVRAKLRDGAALIADGIPAASVVSVITEALAGLVAPKSTVNIPAFETLRTRLARPVHPTPWRIDGVMPDDARVVFSAQFKSGKTTAVGNIMLSLADETPLFGVFPVIRRPGAIVGGLDFEMSEHQLDSWYRAVHIRHDDRVVLVPMRGKATSFNLLDGAVLTAWADRLRAAGVTDLVVDCLRPVLDALGLDENKDAGRFLSALDALKVKAGIRNLIVVHHMGHNGERSRGESRLRDWPDVEWTVVRKSDDPASPRFFKAFGRDVDVAEGQLAFDRDTRRLTLVGGSREDSKHDGVIDEIVDLLELHPDLVGVSIKERLNHGKNVIDAALKRGVTSGRLKMTPGPNNSKTYRASKPVSRFPSASPRFPSGSANSGFPVSPLPIREGKQGSQYAGGDVERI